MQAQKKEGQYPFWRYKKKKKKPRALSVVSNVQRLELLPDDFLIAEGKIENTARLIQLVFANEPKLYMTLLQNPVLDPQSRYLVASQILESPKKLISDRRKYDAINESLTIHYYSAQSRSELIKSTKELSDSFLKLLETAAFNRVRDLEKMPELNYLRKPQDQNSIRFIRGMEVIRIPQSYDFSESLFWETVSNIFSARNVKTECISNKHINDVTHAKLN